MTHSSIAPSCANMTCAGSSARRSHEADAYALGRSYAALARRRRREARRGRPRRAHPFARAARRRWSRGLTEGGLDVVRIGMGPSPMLYFAVATLDVDGGIQVTGSHNPADYNGFKMLLNGRSVFGEEIQELGRRAADGDWSEGQRHGRGGRHRRRLCRRAGRRTSRAGRSGSAGTPATAPAARSSRSWSSACRASIIASTPRSTAASPTTIPTRRSRRTSPT